jgi:hypothetical protein
MFDIRVVEGSPPAAETGAEETTFESLYRTHARRIYSLAYRFTGNAADAEELLQDIFLPRAWSPSNRRRGSGTTSGDGSRRRNARRGWLSGGGGTGRSAAPRLPRRPASSWRSS